jgi:hypothetical protein
MRLHQAQIGSNPLVGHAGHFGKVYVAKKFFGNPANINATTEAKVSGLFQ